MAVLPRSYKPQDLIDLDEAVEILARSKDPVERYLAQQTIERTNKSQSTPAAEKPPTPATSNGAQS